MKTLLIAALFLPLLAGAKDPPTTAYPLRGTVVAIRAGENPVLLPGYTNSKGQHSGELLIKKRTQTYRIVTDSLIYELTKRDKKPTFAIDDVVEFRIEKQSAYVRDGNKEQKYSITSTEKKPSN